MIDNPVGECTRNLNRQVTKEDIQMARKHDQRTTDQKYIDIPLCTHQDGKY